MSLNYIRSLLNMEDEIDELFDRFVEHVNNVPFDDYNNDPSFRLNQSIINNAYLLRRTMELHQTQIRRSNRILDIHPLQSRINIRTRTPPLPTSPPPPTTRWASST